MWPLLTGLVTGGASLLGNIFSSNTSASNTQEQLQAQQGMLTQTENFNAGQTQQQEQFQEQMSNTAYQRASADMEKAGLNPMMMAGGSMNASTPSGASASVGTPNVPMPQTTSPMAGLGDAVSKAVSSAVQAETMDKMVSEVANLKVQNAKIAADTATEQEKPALVRAETSKAVAAGQIAHLGIPSARVGAAAAEDVLGLPDSVRKTLNIGAYGGSKISDAIAPIISSASAVSRFMGR